MGCQTYFGKLKRLRNEELALGEGVVALGISCVDLCVVGASVGGLVPGERKQNWFLYSAFLV